MARPQPEADTTMSEHTDNGTEAARAFIARWEHSGAAERANCQSFLNELCDLIDVPHPDPATADTSLNAYVYERAVTFRHGDGNTSQGFADLYKRGCFVLEAKQGSDAPAGNEPLSEAARDLRRRLKTGVARRGTGGWDDAMLRARGQAEQYARALPTEEGRPPFLVVVDVGHSIELFSEFSCTGGTYIPFPAADSHRIFLRDLERPDIRERLHKVWTAPGELDPTRRSARVTRTVAVQLARLAVSLEEAGHAPHDVAAFLMRCLFTMFAEDVGLLMRAGFTNLMKSVRDTPEHFVPMVEELWQRMNSGGFSTSLRTIVLQFNGGLFEDSTALPLNRDQLMLLIEAAESDWRDVEPAIFGTLLERALEPRERHKLGAHYTPRAYVERLVMPTIIDPVRAEWEAVHVAAVNLANQDEMKKAVAEVKKFHRKLVNIRVLDPACGSGNFLYVTLEHLKRIEGEVFDTLDALGERQAVLEMAGETVDPHQLLGLEINPRAAAIAELVLWIGTLQWHFRNRGNVQPPQPIIRNFHNIECRDALIAWDAVEEVVDEDGNPVTHWDGRTTKTHPVTGKEIPDETARTPVVRYINPRKAEWPEADYVVGNPPFVGKLRVREFLGDGYVDALRKTWGDVPDSADLVMYWWNHTAELARDGKVQRFGFVTTNSLRQIFNRRVLEKHMAAKKPLSLLYAIPDHPWVDSADGAAVRIAMTTAAAGKQSGLLQHVTAEREGGGDGYEVDFDSQTGKIWPDLTIGADVGGSTSLRANRSLSNTGVIPHGKGMVVSRDQAEEFESDAPVRPYLNGRDITAQSRDALVIDCYGLTAGGIRTRFPRLYQWLLEQVKPERDVNRDRDLREKWWLHRRNNEDMRRSLSGLGRFVVTVLTAKHRFFVFVDGEVLPDQVLVTIATDDAYVLGSLSSRIHVCWALAAGGRLGVGNDPRYNKTRCFETFPFPAATDEQKARIRGLAEQLDAHRKRRQAEHPKLTMTGMYNVLEKLRSGEALTDKEKVIHEQGLVTVLRQLHDELDAAVFDAYGWPETLTDDELLERLVALNAERAAEEAQGKVRWLRPEYQNPEGATQQGQLAVDVPEAGTAPTPTAKKKQPWPKSLPDQVRVLREALAGQASPVTAETLARHFTRARKDRVEELLKTLVAMGQARETGDQCFVAG